MIEVVLFYKFTANGNKNLVVGLEEVNDSLYKYHIPRYNHSKFENIDLLFSGEGIYNDQIYKYLVISINELTDFDSDKLSFFSPEMLEEITKELQKGEMDLLLEILFQIITQSGD